MKNRIKFRLVCALFIVALVAGFATCAKESDDGIVVGISMPTLQEERWQKDRDIMIEELIAQGVDPDNILVQSADGDEQKQVEQSENLITQGIDVLIIIPQNGDVASPIVDSAHDAGIPVVAVDRIINNPELDFYIAFDAFQMGVIQGEYIAGITTEGNWVMIAGAPQDPNAAIIRQGQLSVIQPYIDSGDIVVVADQAANNWNPDEALVHTEQALTANNNNVDVVFTSNDGTAGAAIEALEEQGLAGKVPVPGLDADLAAMKRIIAGTQSMTVYRKLSKMDQAAVKIALALANGDDPGAATGLTVISHDYRDISVPAILLRSEGDMFAVDATNVKAIVDDGWLEKEDIYADVPRDQWPNW